MLRRSPVKADWRRWRRAVASLQPLPGAPAREAPDASEARLREVAGRHRQALRLDPIQQLPAGPLGGLAVEVEGEAPVRMLHLGRVGDRIADDDGPLAAGDDQQAHAA